MKRMTYCVVIIFVLQKLFAQAQFGQEFRVTSTRQEEQRFPYVLALSTGDYLVLWENLIEPRSIQARFVRNDGTMATNDFSIIETADAAHYQPRAVQLSSTSVLVCWAYNYYSNWDFDIYCQKLSLSGDKIGQPVQINSPSASPQSYPNAVTFSDGRYLVCWVSWQEQKSKHIIVGQLFSAQGEKVNNEIVLCEESNIVAATPELVVFPNNDFMLIWCQQNEITFLYDFAARSFSSTLQPIDQPFLIAEFVNGGLHYDAVLMPDGLCGITYATYANYGLTCDIFFTKINKKGEQILPPVRVNSFYEGEQSFPQLSLISDTNLCVCWQSLFQDGSDAGVFAQIISHSGQRIGREFQVNSTTRGWQAGPVIAAVKNDQFLICWFTQLFDPYGSDIYGKRYTAAPQKHTLNSFELLKPRNDETIESKSVTLSWQSVSKKPFIFPWEIVYKVYLSSDPAFQKPQIKTVLLDTSVLISDLKNSMTYFWKVLAMNAYGDSLWSPSTNAFFISSTARVKEEIIIPNQFRLCQNYPNPFNPTTEIEFMLPDDGFIKLLVYDIRGCLVKTLINEYKKEGNYNIIWDGKNMENDRVAAGIYLCIAEFTNKNNFQMKSIKMSLIK